VPTFARALLAAALLISGCATQQPSSAPQPQVNLSGFSATFKQGYADGCQHARSQLPRKDLRQLPREGDYAAGWNDGYSICRRRGE
jgi:outer membrane lipoprotein-sorting protein